MDGGFRIRRMEAAHVFMGQTVLAANKNLE
jgi:hypothetical protein